MTDLKIDTLGAVKRAPKKVNGKQMCIHGKIQATKAWKGEK